MSTEIESVGKKTFRVEDGDLITNKVCPYSKEHCGSKCVFFNTSSYTLDEAGRLFRYYFTCKKIDQELMFIREEEDD